SPEQCDDGNGASGDGCSSTCQIEAGYFCNGAGPGSCLLPEGNCNDGIDNNGGGGIDAADPTCAVPAYFPACGAGAHLVVCPAATGLPLAIPDNTPAGVTNTITVSGTTTNLTKVAVLYNITHTFDADVSMFLTPPGGAALDICSGNGSSGDNFVNTVLDTTCA